MARHQVMTKACMATKLVQISYNHPHQLNELLKNAVNPVDSLSLNILQHQ
jgi:hypothetical protein